MKYDHIRQLADHWQLVLGSGSPRRVALLAETGIRFKQIVPDLKESPQKDESPFLFAKRLAKDKALRVSTQLNADHIVIGCDTVVVLHNRILKKPSSEDDAYAILSALAGQNHVVCTALALAQQKKLLASGSELTEVSFNPVTAQQIRDYIATGEPMDKAGAYGIQGMGSFLVDSIKGNLDNVIGLPRMLLNKLAKEVCESR
ncbi:MAG: Maf family protein [Candidatus Zixiibacteriota bacterium]